MQLAGRNASSERIWARQASSSALTMSATPETSEWIRTPPSSSMVTSSPSTSLITGGPVMNIWLVPRTMRMKSVSAGE